MSNLNSAKIILGLDPAFADTGFGVISKENNNLKFLLAGSIQTDKKLDFVQRLEIIYEEIKKLSKLWQPDVVAIEKLYFARNVTTALDVGQARGVALLALAQDKRQILEFTPLQVKQTLTGSGKADKRQVGMMVKAVLKIAAVPKPDDAADALALAICGAWFNHKLALKK